MLRLLLRHRLLIVVGALLALLVAVSVIYRISPGSPHFASRSTTSASATARVLLSAPPEAAADEFSGIDRTMGTRAKLLGDLMSTEPVRANVARDAGLAPHELAIFTPAAVAPNVRIPLAVFAAQAATQTSSERGVVAITADGQVPLLLVRSYAADAAGATRIATATVKGITELVASRQEPGAGFKVERLGQITAVTKVENPSKAVALIAAVVIFSMWCSAVVLVAGLFGTWKRARARRRAQLPQQFAEA